MNPKHVRVLTSCAALMTITTGLAGVPAHAGFLSKLNNAVNKLAAESKGDEAPADAKENVATPKPVASPASPTPPATPVVATSSTPPAKATTAAASGAAEIPAPPDFATKAGTDALIKAIPALSAGDFTLGMPAQKAIDMLTSRKMFVGMTPLNAYYFRMAQIPDQDLIGTLSGTNSDESISLNFTMYPSKPVVSAILRIINYQPGEGPTGAVTLAALRKKYGPEDDISSHNVRLMWLFDYQGHKLSPAQYKKVSDAGCKDESPNIRFAIGGKDNASRQISEGITLNKPGVRSNPNNNPDCMNIIAIKALVGVVGATSHSSITPDYNGWDKFNDGTLTNLAVFISDTPLTVSSVLTTRTIALHNGEVATQKAIEEAKKRKAPSL